MEIFSKSFGNPLQRREAFKCLDKQEGMRRVIVEENIRYNPSVPQVLVRLFLSMVLNYRSLQLFFLSSSLQLQIYSQFFQIHCGYRILSPVIVQIFKQCFGNSKRNLCRLPKFLSASSTIEQYRVKDIIMIINKKQHNFNLVGLLIFNNLHSRFFFFNLYIFEFRLAVFQLGGKFL